MDFSPYIRELILLNECIILPGFGGFETKYKPAKVDKNKKILLPPSKEVIFKRELVKDNGLLTGYVAEKTRMKESKVKKLLEDFTVNLIEKMQSGDKVLLHGVGIFWIDEDFFIHYKEFEGENYLADSYGLSPLEYHKKIEDEYKYKKNIELKPIGQIKRKRTWLWIVAGVIIIFISLLILLQLKSKYIENKDFNLFSFTGLLDIFNNSEDEKIVFGQQKIIEKDSVTRTIEETITKHTKLKNALDYEENVNIIPETGSIEKYEYYIVAGSFKSMQNAIKLKNDLIDYGFAPEIIQTGNGYYRVALKKYADRKKALEELRHIRSKIKYSVWLVNE